MLDVGPKARIASIYRRACTYIGAVRFPRLDLVYDFQSVL